MEIKIVIKFEKKSLFISFSSFLEKKKEIEINSENSNFISKNHSN
jgi:hypothetical protein